MGRRKTKNKWGYKHYTVLRQLGLGIPTYEIQAEGGSIHIVHQNQLFLLLPKEGNDNCMPLVASLHTEIMDSLGWSSGYVPSEVGLIPKECVKMLSVVDTHGLGYAHLQTQLDPITNGLSDLEEGHVS